MKKLLIGVLMFGGLFMTAVPAHAASSVIVHTSGNSHVFVSSSVVSSSSQTISRNCSFSYTITSNGGGTNTVTGGNCTCK